MMILPRPRSCLRITGRVKWFDATRGFGFLVCDGLEGDVLLHFSVLREHGRRSVPEGAIDRSHSCPTGPRATSEEEFISIDLSAALPQHPRSSMSPSERSDRKALAEAAGEFEPVEVKWFNRVRGYGFVKRPDDLGGEDVFVHMETVRVAHLGELQPGQNLEARIAPSGKGLTAVELRARGLSRIAAAAAAVLVACSPQAQAPAQNTANDEQAQAPASSGTHRPGCPKFR